MKRMLWLSFALCAGAFAGEVQAEMQQEQVAQLSEALEDDDLIVLEEEGEFEDAMEISPDQA